MQQMDQYHDIQATELFLCSVDCSLNVRLFPDVSLHGKRFDVGVLLIDDLCSPLGSL
jgi:hypothetical protein